MTLRQIAAQLEEISWMLREKPTETPANDPVWECSICGNQYSFLDGSRTLTRNRARSCPGMPKTIRITRAVHDIRYSKERVCSVCADSGRNIPRRMQTDV